MSSDTVQLPPITARQIEAAANHHAGPFPVANIGEEGEHYITLDHVDPHAFLAQVDAENTALGVDPWDPGDVDDSDVQHRWAISEEPANADAEWAVSWSSANTGPVTETTPGAFPITLLSLEI